MNQVVRVWKDPKLGPLVRVVGGFLAIPVLVRLIFSQDPPVGVFLNGLIIGALYGLIAMGLVLVYRAARVINIAQANIGAAPAVLGLTLFAKRDWPYWACVLILVIGSPLLGAVVDRFVVRPFSKAPRLILAVVLIGVGQALSGVEALIPKWVSGDLNPATEFETPLGSVQKEIGGVFFSGDHLLAVVVVILVAAGLAAFFRYTSIGIAVRASAENGDRAALLGIPVSRVSTIVWMVAGLLSGIGIFLRGPLVGLPLGGQIGPVILLYALAAAVLARMESLPLALIAGMGLGMLDQGVYYGAGFKPNVSNALLLPLLLIALLAQRGKLSRALDTGVSTWSTVREFRPIPPELRNVASVVWARRALLAVVALFALAAPFLVGELERDSATLVLIYAMVGVSLVVLTGWAGQISLGQFAFVGVGAAVAGGLAADAGWDFFVCVACGGLVGAAGAVVLGIPALRIQGLFLAVTTLAFATNMQSFFLNRDYFAWVLPESTNPVARPFLWQRIDVTGDAAFYYLCLVFLLLVVAAARSLRNSRSGRLLIATRDNGKAAQSYGVSLARSRLAAFAIAGFVAATAGALLSYRSGAVDAGVFTPQESLSVFTMAVIGGITSIPGVIVAAVVVVGSNQLLSPNTALLVTGVGVIIVLRLFPGGLAEVGVRARDAFLRREAARLSIHVPSLVADSLVLDAPPEDEPTLEAAADRSKHRVAAVAAEVESVEDPILVCRGVDVAYDRVQVLFGVDLEVRRGEIVALLGTNGAGKSTLLKAVCGLVKPTAGTITLDGEALPGGNPAAAVKRGIVQVPGGRAVFPTLTVAENLKAASWLFRKDGARVATATEAVLGRFPRLRERYDQLAGNLSGGEQQMLGLGMAFLAEPKILVIDELSLGLAPTIVEQLLGMVREIHAGGATIILVEQSVNIALTVADRAFFMEKGQVRFSGPTAELLGRDDIVRSVFLEGAGAGVPATAAAERRELPADGTPILTVDTLSRRFGGITAVDAVSFSLGRGEVLGLIGPNGAGKTTVFDLVSGFVTPDAGSITFEGVDVTRWSPDRRARAGLGRSFQDARIFPSLTVAENVAMGLERHLEVRDHLATALHLPAAVAVEEDVAWTVADLIELLNLGAYANKLVGELSTGSRRIVDLAMAIGHDPSVLVLDEPSSGIAQAETEALVPLLRRIQSETGCSLLVIEHDMPLITAVSDRMLALELGRVIASGTPEDVIADPQVVSSYLGGDPRVVQRSGAV